MQLLSLGTGSGRSRRNVFAMVLLMMGALFFGCDSIASPDRDLPAAARAVPAIDDVDVDAEPTRPEIEFQWIRHDDEDIVEVHFQCSNGPCEFSSCSLLQQPLPGTGGDFPPVARPCSSPQRMPLANTYQYRFSLVARNAHPEASSGRTYFIADPERLTARSQDRCRLNAEGLAICSFQNARMYPVELELDEEEQTWFAVVDESGEAPTDWAKVVSPWVRQHAEPFGCGIRGDGSLWCWGQWKWPGVPHYRTPNRRWHDEWKQTDARPVATPTDWIDLVVGKRFVCALREKGEIWCWGHHFWTASEPVHDPYHCEGFGIGMGVGVANCYSQLPVGRTWFRRLQRVRTTFGEGYWNDWVSLKATEELVCAERRGGSTWCWSGHYNDNPRLERERGRLLERYPVQVGW